MRHGRRRCLGRCGRLGLGPGRIRSEPEGPTQHRDRHAGTARRPSELKAAADKAAAEKKRAEAERASLAEQAELEAREDAEILAELDLPDPDTLEAGDDVVAFMARAVPERLRRRALRRLWRVNPVLANLDGLNDYDEDFNVTARDTGAVRTAYKVGKGMLAHIEALAREAERTAEPLAEEAEPLSEEEVAEEVVIAEAVIEEAPEAPFVADARPRRMQFSFDDGDAA